MSVRDPGKKGFTLIELLVVLAILVLLASILVPTTGRALTSARRSACMSNLRQLNLGFTLYHLDHQNFPSPERWYFSSGSSNPADRGFRDYLTGSEGLSGTSGEMRIFRSPLAAAVYPPRTDAHNTYALNMYLSNHPTYGLNSMMRVENPSSVMHFMYGLATQPFRGGFHYRPSLYDLSGPFSINQRGMDGTDRFYDGGYSTIVYLDGRVGRISRERALEITYRSGPERTAFWRGR